MKFEIKEGSLLLLTRKLLWGVYTPDTYWIDAMMIYSRDRATALSRHDNRIFSKIKAVAPSLKYDIELALLFRQEQYQPSGYLRSWLWRFEYRQHLDSLKRIQTRVPPHDSTTNMPSNLERLARRKKRQTRLTFDPVDGDSSSPAARTSPAKVRYQKEGTGEKQTGTPSSSFQIVVNQSASGDMLSSGHKSASTPNRKGKGKKNSINTPSRMSTRKRSARLGKTLPTPAKSSQAIGTFCPLFNWYMNVSA